jgi:hypothetical protein
VMLLIWVWWWSGFLASCVMACWWKCVLCCMVMIGGKFCTFDEGWFAYCISGASYGWKGRTLSESSFLLMCMCNF